MTWPKGKSNTSRGPREVLRHLSDLNGSEATHIDPEVRMVLRRLSRALAGFTKATGRTYTVLVIPDRHDEPVYAEVAGVLRRPCSTRDAATFVYAAANRRATLAGLNS